MAIRNAITACETSTAHAPYTIVIPAGTYKLALHDCTRDDLNIQGPNAVTIVGAGRDRTRLVEWIGLKNPSPYSCKHKVWYKSLLGLHSNGSGVQGVKLDTLTYNAGSALMVDADRTLVRNVWITHGDMQASPPMFTIHYGGGPGADRSHNCTFGSSSYCHTGNVIDDMVVYDKMCDDGLAFAFQRNAVINHLRYQGSRLALYILNGLTLSDFNYSPGLETTCSSKQGFWLTSPSANITINNYTTSGGDAVANTNWTIPAIRAGGAGVLGTSQNGNTYHSYGVHVNGYHPTGTFADQLIVANITTDFVMGPGTVEPCDFGTNNALRIAPQVSVSGVNVNQCSLSQTIIAPAPGVRVSGVRYTNDTFRRQSPQTYSWTDMAGAPVVVTLSGGSFRNCYTVLDPLRFRTADPVHVRFARAPGAPFPTQWSCV